MYVLSVNFVEFCAPVILAVTHSVLITAAAQTHENAAHRSSINSRKHIIDEVRVLAVSSRPDAIRAIRYPTAPPRAQQGELTTHSQYK